MCAQGHKATRVQLGCKDVRAVLSDALGIRCLEGLDTPLSTPGSGMPGVKLDSIH